MYPSNNYYNSYQQFPQRYYPQNEFPNQIHGQQYPNRPYPYQPFSNQQYSTTPVQVQQNQGLYLSQYFTSKI